MKIDDDDGDNILCILSAVLISPKCTAENKNTNLIFWFPSNHNRPTFHFMNLKVCPDAKSSYCLKLEGLKGKHYILAILLKVSLRPCLKVLKNTKVFNFSRTFVNDCIRSCEHMAATYQMKTGSSFNNHSERPIYFLSKVMLTIMLLVVAR